MPEPSPVAAPDSRYATRASLIDRLRAADSTGWERLVELYQPLMRHWATGAGIAQQDFHDVCQDVFKVVVVRIGSFQLGEHRGSFRKWLREITRNVCREQFRRNGGARAPGGTEAAILLNEVPDPLGGNEDDPAELVADLFRQTLRLVRGEFSNAHWAVFERLAFDSWTPAAVAAEQRLSEVNVRAIKSRIYRRLREELGDVFDLPANAGMK